MGTTLANPDFKTSRPPFRAPADPQEADSVPYTCLAEFNDHFPTDGSPRKFYQVVRVQESARDAFLRAMLPDVREDRRMTLGNQILVLSAFAEQGKKRLEFNRYGLTRFDAEPHWRYPEARVTEITAIGGDGYPAQQADGTLGFFTKFADARYARPGSIRFGVTYQDLPYIIQPSDAGLNDFTANKATSSEIVRYTIFKPQPKGQNLQIPGGSFFYVDDDGTLIQGNVPVVAGGNDINGNPVVRPGPPLQIPEAQPLYVPATDFTITLKMVPRIPYAAEAMKGMVNVSDDIPVPVEILRDKPDRGTLLYRGYELSDPYFTVSGQKVFDIHYALSYRASGKDLHRGWNAAYCGVRREFRRVVSGRLLNNQQVARVPDGLLFPLPVTVEDDNQAGRPTYAGVNLYDFGELQNLFRFEGERTDPAKK